MFLPKFKGGLMPFFNHPFKIPIPDSPVDGEKLEKAVRFAYEAEKEAAEIYRVLAVQTTDKSVKEIFKKAAEDDNRHVAELEAVLENMAVQKNKVGKELALDML
ncbi:MAG: hypothetical protein GF401_02725 [Chitinivibrionales bacterium]|nr:hypothetical protein [Chitinivibrionales bacterium]